MNIEDLTVAEQAEYQEWAEAAARQEFEERTWGVKCRLCGCIARDTQKNLEARGWLLKREGEFCPTHNFKRQQFRNRLTVTHQIV